VHQVNQVQAFSTDKQVRINICELPYFSGYHILADYANPRMTRTNLKHPFVLVSVNNDLYSPLVTQNVTAKVGSAIGST